MPCHDECAIGRLSTFDSVCESCCTSWGILRMDCTLMIEENNGHPIGFVAGFSFLSYFEEERFHCDDRCLVFCHNRRIKFHHC